MTDEKRFKFDVGYDPVGKSDNINGVIYQRNLETFLEILRKQTTEKPKVWSYDPIISLYYEREGKSIYEHFCSLNCVGMFRVRAKELQVEIDRGAIKNFYVFRTEFGSSHRPIQSKLHEVFLDSA